MENMIMKMMQYKKTVLIFIALSLICSIQPASAVFQGSSDAITFTNIPEKVEIMGGDSVDFDVTLINEGSMYGDINLVFRNLPDGITVIEGKKYQLMDVRKSKSYHVVLESNESIKSGAYQFEIADNSDIDTRTWESIILIVHGTNDAVVSEPRVAEGEDADEKQTPAFTLIQLLAVLLTLSITIRMGKHEAK